MQVGFPLKKNKAPYTFYCVCVFGSRTLPFCHCSTKANKTPQLSSCQTSKINIHHFDTVKVPRVLSRFIGGTWPAPKKYWQAVKHG